MHIQSLTDIGSTRKENQDNYWSATLNIDGIETGFVCMCDGMGGLDNGGLASKIIVESVRDSVLKGIALYDLRDIIYQSNSVVYNLSSSGSKMGSTCTILCCRDGKYIIHHVGDSRCYRVQHDSITQLSRDHSVISEYGITKEENLDLYNRYKNKLTRCIGVKEDVTIDVIKGNYEDGDIFLLCSDGFWHYFESSDYMLNLNNLEECIKECINYGETDNISVSLLYT